MILPNDDEIKERGVKLCVMAVHEFFCLVFPEVAKEKNIDLDEDTIMTYYSLASSDEDYVQLIAKAWDIDVDAEAINFTITRRTRKRSQRICQPIQRADTRWSTGS